MEFGPDVAGPIYTGNVSMLGELSGLIALLAFIVSVSNTVWTWISKGQTATADRVKKTEEDIDKVEARVLQLEGDYKHLPTKEDVNGLKLQLTEVSGQLRSTDNELKSVGRTVGRIDNYLREKA